MLAFGMSTWVRIWLAFGSSKRKLAGAFVVNTIYRAGLALEVLESASADAIVFHLAWGKLR